MSVDVETLREGLALTLEHTDLSGLGTKIEGKVRDSYLPGDGRRILVTTDRISAFDRVLGTLPFKGQVLNQLSAWWFRETADVAPNHLREVPDPSVTVAVECEPLPVEWVMRAYLTGVTSTSVWTHYSRGEREFCGHRLPDGLKKNEPLPAPILTPSTKAEKGGHDESVSRAALLSRGVIDEETFERAAAMVAALFARGREVCAKRGLILVDTKYELGRAADGSIVVIDEIHTPDSSRILVRRLLRSTFERGRRARELRQRVRPAVARSAGLQGRRADPGHPRRRARRGIPPLHRGVRHHPRRHVRAGHVAATYAHPREPGIGGRMKANIYVTLKREVLDPQGDAVRRATGSLGFAGVRDVRVGKLIEVELDDQDREAAEATLRTMCEKLLANPVIEDYRFELV